MPPTKRRYKSGAQKRKERAARATSLVGERVTVIGRDAPYGAGAWPTQDAYKGTGDLWDPKAPPVELPVYGAPPTTLVSSVAATLVQLEQGAFYSAAYLWDGMMRDDRISAVLNVRTSGLTGQRLDVQPGEDSEAGQNVSDEVEKKIEKLIPSHQVGQLLRYGIGLSVGLAQVLSTRTSKSRDATIKVWNPRYLRFDWLLRKYRLVTANRGEITIEPDDPEWVLYEPYGPYGWLHGAALRSLAQPWLIRYWSRTWWSREREVHGQPIRAGIIPTKRDPGDEKIFLKQLSTLAHEATIRLPQGEDGNKFDLKLIQAQSDGWRGFKEILDHCDDSIAILLLGQRMSTKGVGGLGSQDKAGESTLLRILRQDARVGDVLRERVLMPWAEDNYGRAELAPYLKWEIEPPADLDKKSKALLTVSQALAQFALAPEYARNVDVRALLEEYDLPLNAEGDLPELPKPQDDEPAEDPAQEDETTDEPAEQDHADE